MATRERVALARPAASRCSRASVVMAMARGALHAPTSETRRREGRRIPGPPGFANRAARWP
eukprot:1488245-Pyramimonas_sp.AAC.1